jgi:hypothetical protein
VEAIAFSKQEDVYPIGLLYQNEDVPKYDEICAVGIHTTPGDKIRALNQQLDRFAI